MTSQNSGFSSMRILQNIRISMIVRKEESRKFMTANPNTPLTNSVSKEKIDLSKKPFLTSPEQKAIVFLDLDGTLWMHEIIPDSALKAIREARENGHLIFVNTGRSKDGAIQSIQSVPTSGQVYSAGTEIWMDGKRIFYSPMPSHKAKALFDRLQTTGCGIMIEGSDSSFSDQITRDYLQQLAARQGISSRYLHVPFYEDMRDEDWENVMKISVHGLKPGEIDSFLQENGMVLTLFSNLDFKDLLSGEITMKDLNKGTAFQSIQDALYKQFTTIAIGDSANDLPMFEAADLAIAMGNGTQEAKAAASWITDTIDNDGLYKAFEAAGLIKSR